MIAFYMDENVRGAVTRGLRRRGVDALTVPEDGRAEAEDDEVLQRAAELRRVLFSQDEDLLRVATAFQRRGDSFSGVVYAHQRDVSIGQCIADLEIIAKASEFDEYANRVEYLPL